MAANEFHLLPPYHGRRPILSLRSLASLSIEPQVETLIGLCRQTAAGADPLPVRLPGNQPGIRR
jgi:hypothetical protein